MKLDIKTIAIVILGALALKPIVFPTRQIPSIPTIVTHYDTVRVIDTAWVTKLKHDTVYATNIVERVVTQKPDTITLHHFYPVNGVTTVLAGARVGDTTKVLSFKLVPKDTLPVATFTFHRFMYVYYTPGPLEAVYLTDSGTPHLTFYPPPNVCNLGCRLKIAGEGALVVTVIRSLLGH